MKINTTFIVAISYFKEFYKDQFLVPYGLIITSVIYFFALKGTDTCNFADDTTLYVCDSNLKSVLETLENNSEVAIAWFEMNYMKLKTNKCHLLISGHKNEQMYAKLEKDIVWESTNVKPLRITLDNQLKFEKHVFNICSKAN